MHKKTEVCVCVRGWGVFGRYFGGILVYIYIYIYIYVYVCIYISAVDRLIPPNIKVFKYTFIL